MPTFINKKLLAEFIGTFILVFIAVGAARVSGVADLNFTGISIAFGAALIGAAYAIGSVSGCHINPAVSIGAWAAGRMSIADMIGYIIAQCAGAIAAAFLLTLILAGQPETVPYVSGANTFGAGNSAMGANLLQAAIFEVTATAIFVFVILGVTAKENTAMVAGLVIGITLIGIHLVGIPITGTSVNPARSLGPVLFTTQGAAWACLPIFLIFPSLGGFLGGLIWRVLFNEPEEAELS